MSYSPPTKPNNPISRLGRWFWLAFLVWFGLFALVVFGMFISDGAWRWAIPLFAFFAFVAYVQIRNQRRRGQ